MTLFPKKDDPQGYGSAITYARRYSLASLMCLVQADDDGNEASARREERDQKAENRRRGAEKAKATRERKKTNTDSVVNAFAAIGVGEDWITARTG